MKVYWVTFWYGGYSLESIKVYANSKKQVRRIMKRQFGVEAKIESIEKEGVYQ